LLAGSVTCLETSDGILLIGDASGHIRMLRTEALEAGDVSGYTWRAHEGKVSALCIGGAEKRTLLRYDIYIYTYIYI